MKLSLIRDNAKERLKQHNIDIKDADYIISEILSKPVTTLFIDGEVNNEKVNLINECVNKRIDGMPVSKIFNKAYFCGLELFIDNNVLSPRQETELLVESAVDEIITKCSCNKTNDSVKVLDLCCGSGAIACAIKKATVGFNVKVTATDISEPALSVAKTNANNLMIDIDFVKSNMFDSLNEQFDVIVSNPPYIESDVCKSLDKEVKNFDPIIALDGGIDGLDFYRQIVKNVKYLKPNGVVILEIGYNQGEKVKSMFEKAFKKVEVTKDYNNQDRIVICKNINL